jgi:hypothetical protein
VHDGGDFQRLRTAVGGRFDPAEHDEAVPAASVRGPLVVIKALAAHPRIDVVAADGAEPSRPVDDELLPGCDSQ